MFRSDIQGNNGVYKSTVKGGYNLVIGNKVLDRVSAPTPFNDNVLGKPAPPPTRALVVEDFNNPTTVGGVPQPAPQVRP